ncbi:MAG: hypothetical protein F2663_04785 [Actinobacteria bacterium]|uniref:histidine kinase n=1 Tax=freshwater metagenome TaxID=449393 RepID=A0A6J6PE55_9ZZZZ|nr:hypothetical protein [Actinomycetota bacterium]
MTSFPLSERVTDRPTRSRSARNAYAFLLAGAVAIAIYLVLPSQVQSVVFVLIGLAGVFAIVGGARMHLIGSGRIPWYLFAAGIAGQVCGDIVTGYYELWFDREPPLPSVADAFYLGGYPAFIAGIVILQRRLGGATSRAAVLDTVIVATAIGAVQWVFFLQSTYEEHIRASARIVDSLYPTMDTLLLVGLAQLLIGPGRRSPSYRLLVVSVALWVVGDELYVLYASTYVAGGWIDVFLLGSYVVFGTAALEPSVARISVVDRRIVPRLTRTRLMVLVSALLAVPFTVVVERLEGRHFHVLFEAGAASVIALLVLARLAGLVGAVEAARDDERAALEQAESARLQLAAQNLRLLELDRLKDEFVAGVSHELRTPLTSIAGYAELMLETENDPGIRNHLEIIERNAERLLRLVSDLLFAARLQTGQLDLDVTDVDLRELVRQAVESAQMQAEAADVTLDIDVLREPLHVEGAPDRLTQLLDNLVSNALKFTPAGGRVSISLRRGEGAAVLEVSDTGIGIPADELTNLFQRFYRSRIALDRQIQGTGLGLYLSKAIVDAHRGRIDVRSTEGKGTTFVVEIPERRS